MSKSTQSNEAQGIYIVLPNTDSAWWVSELPVKITKKGDNMRYDFCMGITVIDTSKPEGKQGWFRIPEIVWENVDEETLAMFLSQGQGVAEKANKLASKGKGSLSVTFTRSVKGLEGSAVDPAWNGSVSVSNLEVDDIIEMEKHFFGLAPAWLLQGEKHSKKKKERKNKK